MQCPQEADLQCMFSIQLLYRKSGVQKGQVSFPEPQSCILLVFVQGMAGKGHEEEDEIKKMLLFLRYLLWTVFTTIPLFSRPFLCCIQRAGALGRTGVMCSASAQDYQLRLSIQNCRTKKSHLKPLDIILFSAIFG